MMTLLLDTHTNEIVIVLYENDQILIEKEVSVVYNHSIDTIPTLVETLEKVNKDIHDLTEIIIVNGPGSFTGVRIGVTIAKTLAYTLNIPIKVMSSLLIKAVSTNHQGNINIGEEEKNGLFYATFTKDNELIGDYEYYSNNESKNLKNDYVKDILIDYLKVYEYAQTIKPTNPHAVNPLYVKKIGVQK